MDFFEVVAGRHSYRGGFTERKVSREDLVTIVQAGLDGPSGCNAQTTRFVIVDDAELVGKIAAMHPANKAMAQAKAFIACIVDKSAAAVYEDLAFQIEDCAAAVENMLLAVTALGYASVWIDGWLRREGRNETIGKLLGVPDEKIVRVLLPVGVPEQTVRGPEKMGFDERASFNQF